MKKRDIRQGDIFWLLRDKKFLGYTNGNIVNKLMIEICIPRSIEDSRISEICNGKKNGFSEWQAWKDKEVDFSKELDKFYQCFIVKKIKNKYEYNTLLDRAKEYVKENGLGFDNCGGLPDDTLETYMKRMLEAGLTNTKKIPSKKEKENEQTENPDTLDIPVVNVSPKLKSNNWIEPDKFTGREDLLEDIQKRLQNDHAVVLSGIGGIGKTMLCEQFCHLHGEQYPTIQKVVYDENTGTFEDMISRLSFENIDDKQWNDKERYQRKYDFLKKCDNSVIIIFDNIDKKPEDIEVFRKLRRESKVNVIITTRISDFFEENITVRVDALEKENQIKLFEKHYRPLKNKEEIANVTKLLSFVQGHTLMITLLAFLIRKGFTIKKVLEMWESDSYAESNILVRATKDDNNIEGNIIEVLEKIFRIGSLNPQQQTVLYEMIFLPTEGISREFLLMIMEEYMDPINELGNNGWITFSVEKDYIKIHPVIQDMIRKNIKRSFSDNKAFFDKIHSAITMDESREYAEDLCKLMQSITEIILFDDTFNNDCMEKILDMEQFCYQNYKYGICRNLCDTAVNIAQKNDGHIFLVPTLVKLYTHSGKIYQRLAEYDRAIEYYQKAIDCQNGIESAELGKSYRNLGEVYRKASKYSEALEWDNKALEIFKNIGSNSIDIAEAKNAIGVVYLNKDEFDNALKYYMEALELRLKIPERLRDLAFSYHNIGTAYNRTHQYEKALEYHKKGLQIRIENNLEQTDIAASYTWLGNDYLQLKNMDESKKNIDEALSIREKILGKNHPDYAWTLDTLVSWYEEKKDYENALKTIRMVKKIRMDCLGEKHKYTLKAIEREKAIERKNDIPIV